MIYDKVKKDRPVSIVINSYNDELPELENPDTWDNVLLVHMRDSQGKDYVRRIHKEAIIREKFKSAEVTEYDGGANYPKVETVAQFLQRKFNKVFACPKNMLPYEFGASDSELEK